MDGDEVGLDEGDVVGALEHADDTGVVNAGDEDGEEVVEEHGLFLEVEGEGLVVTEESKT